MLSPDIPTFCGRWIQKAEDAVASESLEGMFDGFFSYFVAFNRLYGIATLDLADKGKVKLPKNRFPDSRAARVYVADYIKPSKLVQLIESDPHCNRALEEVAQILKHGIFWIKLDAKGNHDPKGDADLLAKLTSATAQNKASAILDLLYTLRCNMFHGHKGFDRVQEGILKPATILLRKVALTLLEELKTSHS